MKHVSLEEVAKHNKEGDAWIVVDGKVLDVSVFLEAHPGGKKVLLNECGKDASAKFRMFHKRSVLDAYAKKLQVGVVAKEGEACKRQPAKPASAPSGGQGTNVHATFGDMVPYGDPAWYQRYHTPYYKDTHVQYRALVRKFVDEELLPNVKDWDEAGLAEKYTSSLPAEVYQKAYKAGILPGVVGTPWPEKYAGKPPVANWDAFHELILIDELSRCASAGVSWALWLGLSVGLPPVLKFGSDALKDRVAPNCLQGRKFICLAVSEPWTASDVAGLKTTARREGDYYIVNGAKKWITNGVWCDYFTVAVRTGPEGHGGLSFLLLEKGMPGITCRKMKCMGMWGSGTTYITLEDVKVPVSNLIGKENEGFKYIMYNFNHERWQAVIQANRYSRICLEEAFKYALKRKTFGKRLIDHQVIRWKVAEMARQVEATHSQLEALTYQLMNMPMAVSNDVLGGPIALLKAHASKTLEYCAREAAQIFGGASYVRGGVGEKVERIYREVRAFAIPGGSEEILLDFAARQAEKSALKLAKL